MASLLIKAGAFYRRKTISTGCWTFALKTA